MSFWNFVKKWKSETIFRYFYLRGLNELKKGCYMIVKDLSFGTITIDGEKFEKDVIIENGAIKKRNKEVSKKYTFLYGHTPLSADENIPWNCKHLIIGNGQNSALPVMEDVRDLALQKGVDLQIMNTREAVKHINDAETNLVLHLTC